VKDAAGAETPKPVAEYNDEDFASSIGSVADLLRCRIEFCAKGIRQPRCDLNHG